MVQVYLARLPEGERGPKNQSQWAHGLLEEALKRQYPEIRKPILLERDSKGKPFLLEYPGIYMNLSHSGGYAACALGEKPVGIDIECHRSRKRQDLVVKRFHPKEQKLYQAADETQRELLFHELWVLKECFMKAEGSGLRIPLDSFYMEEIGDGMGKVIQGQDGKNYYYKLYHIRDQEFSLGVCSQETDFLEKPIWLKLWDAGEFAY